MTKSVAVFRCFIDGVLQWEEEAGGDFERLAGAHQQRIGREAGDRPWHVEIEVLLDPADPERFLRFGTDTKALRDPQPLSAAPQHPWGRAYQQ